MTRKTSFDRLEVAPRWIFVFLGAYLAVHLFALYLWNAAGQAFPLQGTSDNTSALSVTGMAGLDLWLCLVVLRSFPAGAPLRPAWMLITLAAAARAGSDLLAQTLGTNWLLNPLVWAGHAKSGSIEQIRHAALIGGGPVRLALLAGGMLAVLRILRKFGFWVRPSATDWAMCGIVCLFTLCRFGEAGAASLAGREISLENWISLAGLPILCVLFLEAMLLRRSVARMGNGLIARGWFALVCGILLTGAGEVALWVIPHYSQTLPLAMFGALIHLPIAAAFALAPAYQLAAQRRAMRPASNPPADLAAGIPALV
ncbi:MAG: hypothetical protein NTW28_34830 [Candidatus Solibacter sp.]|nr:hypothetical protein [Candidatus Solibacter sp.]